MFRCVSRCGSEHEPQVSKGVKDDGMGGLVYMLRGRGFVYVCMFVNVFLSLNSLSKKFFLIKIKNIKFIFLTFWVGFRFFGMA